MGNRPQIDTAPQSDDRFHLVVDGDRIDLLAYKYFNDPTLWWVICDWNEVFDQHQVTFISVTQSFYTTTSMGRLTLNILLSFAQFEREVTGERIRDKFAASKKKGMFMGGNLMLGYDVNNRKLVINKKEAVLVNRIFNDFICNRSTIKLVRELHAEGYKTKTWVTTKGEHRKAQQISKMYLHRILTNRVYIGQITHKGSIYEGEHTAIITTEQWDKVQSILAENPHERSNAVRLRTPALLQGILRCGHCDASMGITYTGKSEKQYRYYLCYKFSKYGDTTCPVKRISAGTIEQAVISQLRRFLTTPELIAVTARKMKLMANSKPMSEKEILKQLGHLNSVWDELFPVEQSRLLQLMVKQVVVSGQGVDVQMHADGLYLLITELQGDSINE